MNGASRSGVAQSQTIRLEIQYSDQAGNYVDPSAYPTVSIVDPTNKIVLNATAHPVGHNNNRYPHTFRDNEHEHHEHIQRQDVGLYYFDYRVPDNATLGNWSDIWSVGVNGIPFTKLLNFTVNTQASPVTANAGQEIDPLLSQEATKNVLLLMKLLRLRLGSDGTRRKRDQFGKFVLDVNGNNVLEPCNVFTTEELYWFLKAALAEFNSIPHFTSFTFTDHVFVETFQHELTEGAVILSLALQGLREKGREFTMTDDGISYNAPQIADYLKQQMNDYMTSYRERIKFIKCQMKPYPRGFGTVYSLAGGGVSPAFIRLRHLRARQII
jgi:hypothetical protein